MARELAAYGLLVLIAYAAMTLLDGLMRSFANRPIELVRDLDSVVIAAAMRCCFPITYQMRSNICIKFAGMTSAAVGTDTRRLRIGPHDGHADLMAWQLFLFAQAQAANGDATVMLEIRTAPFWYFVSCLMAFAAFVQLLTAVSDICRCFGANDDATALPQAH